jgi:membrane-associated phospholipid phosphatase
LLTASTRLWAAALLISCAVLVAVFGVLFAHEATADRLDYTIDSPMVTWFGAHRGLGGWLISPGALIPAGALSAAIVVGCLLAGRLNGAVLAATAIPVADGLSDGLLKPLVHRTYLGVLTYPSGHTTAIFALATAVTVMLTVPPHPVKTGKLHVSVTAAVYVVACAVAIALIGLRFHYFTDTVAGAALGIGTVCGLALLLDLSAVRSRFDHRSRTSEEFGVLTEADAGER